MARVRYVAVKHNKAIKSFHPLLATKENQYLLIQSMAWDNKTFIIVNFL